MGLTVYAEGLGAIRKGYAPGPFGLCAASSDTGTHAACVTDVCLNDDVRMTR